MSAGLWSRLGRDPRAQLGLGVSVALVAAALLAPLIAHGDPAHVALMDQLQPPSVAHWLGTDLEGRDIWSRLVFGARISLGAGIVSQTITLGIGLTLGLIAGFYGSWIDETVMRLADITLAFPTLLLLIALAAALRPSLGVVFVTIGVVGWAGMARLVRGQVLVVRQLEFVQAARALGTSDARILLRHVLPSVMSPVIIAVTLGMAAAIMAEASLSFLGLGVQPPATSWGLMLRDADDLSQLRNAPWTSVFPGLAIGLTVLGFNLLGDSLRDALDVRGVRGSAESGGSLFGGVSRRLIGAAPGMGGRKLSASGIGARGAPPKTYDAAETSSRRHQTDSTDITRS